MVQLADLKPDTRLHRYKPGYTEHCSVGPTNFIETIGTARLKIRDYRYGTAEDFSTARLKISDEDFG